MPPSDQNQNPGPVGPFAAIIIVVLILAIGGAYFFITQEMKIRNTPQETPNS